MIIVLPPTDHRPGGGDGRDKESLGDLQQPVRERQTPRTAERRSDLTGSEVTTKLYPDSEQRREASRSPAREVRGSDRPVREKTGAQRERESVNAAPTRAASQRTLRRGPSDADSVSTVYPADSASALGNAGPHGRSTSVATSVRTPLLPVRDERDIMIERLTAQLKQTEENSMLVSRGLEMRKQESEAILLTETQSLKGTLAQTQGAARAFQERTHYFEEVAKAESKRATQLKEERSKDLETNFLREVTQREKALKAELDGARRTEQAAVRDACNKIESAVSERQAHQEHDDRVKILMDKLVTEQREKERLARELELERAKKQKQVQSHNTTFHSISTPRKTSSSLFEPERSSSGVEHVTGTSSDSTIDESDRLTPLPSSRRQAKNPKEVKGIVTMGGSKTVTQTKVSSRVKSSCAGSTREGSSMPSRKGFGFDGGSADGNDDDDGDDDKKKKKKDHHSSTDSSDSDEKDKKKK
eukprot:6256704-Amphidinium_carterae.1